MAPACLYDRFVEPAVHAHANESALDPDHSQFRILQAKCWPDIRLVLRPARSSDGDALQTYIRGLSPQSRYNRLLAAANELAAPELARALGANGRDALTLLLTLTLHDRETVVGEARVALSCTEGAGEFSMSIADAWQHVGVGSTLLKEIERKAAAAGIKLLFGDTLRTNETMIGLARARGFGLGPGFEPRLVRIRKWLEEADPDPPCWRWSKIASGTELRSG
jgi:GNAT superfamily N-acetyltransferase